MSRAIANSLQFQKTSLSPLINEAIDLQVEQPDHNLPLEEQINELDGQKRRFINVRSKMEQRVDAIHHYHGRWLTFLEETKSQEREHEFYEKKISEAGSFLEIEMRARDAMTNLASSIQHVEDIVASATTRRSLTPQLPQAQQPASNVQSVHLPTLKLKLFSGQLEEWPAFKASFQAAVGDNPQIALISKLNYLLSLLEGGAARVVAGYALIPDNYSVVWRALEEHFGSNDAIINNLYNRLDKVERADHNIRTTVDELECILRQLEAQGESLETRQMHRCIEQKMPQWAILSVLEEKEKHVRWTVQLLRHTLCKLALKREQARQICQGQTHPDKDLATRRDNRAQSRNTMPKAAQQYQQRGSNRYGNMTTTAYPATANPRPSNSNPLPARSCTFCGEGHWSDQCMRYSTVPARTAKAIEMKLCFGCLRTGHSTRTCEKRKKCFHCKKQGHHSSLCKERSTFDGRGQRYPNSRKSAHAVNVLQEEREAEVITERGRSEDQIEVNSKSVCLATAYPHRFEPPKRPARCCHFCGEGHWSDQCKRYSTKRRRMKRAVEKKLCFNCLQVGHSMRNCAKRKECFHCIKRGHHSALCKGRQETNKQTKQRPRSHETAHAANVTRNDVETKADAEGPGSKQRIDVTSATAIRNQHRKVTTKRGKTTQEAFLLCKEILVSNPRDPRHATVVTALFDSGCQGTFATDDLVKKLNLERKGPQKMTVTGFGGVDPTTCDTEEVSLNVHLINGSAKRVQTNSIKRITQEIEMIDWDHQDDEILECVEETKLSLPTKCTEPSVVIGIDYYYQFIPNTPRQMKSGFQLVDSEVGRMICGKGNIEQTEESHERPRNTLMTAGSFVSLTALVDIANDNESLDSPHDMKVMNSSDPNVEREVTVDDEDRRQDPRVDPHIPHQNCSAIGETKELRLKFVGKLLYHFFLLLTLFVVLLINADSASASREMVRARRAPNGVHPCSSGTAWTTFIPFPPLLNCSNSGRSVFKKVNVTIYRKKFVRMEAEYCSLKTRTVCTDTILRWRMAVVSDSSNVTSVPPVICEEMREAKTVYGNRLKKRSKNRWSTNNPITFSFGWFGQRCTTTKNHLLEEGEIAVINGTHILSDMTSSCSFESGKCTTPSATILWNPLQLKTKCHLHEQGRYEALVSDDRVVVESIQEVFIRTSNSSVADKNCNLTSLWNMENDVFIAFEMATHHLQSEEQSSRTFLIEENETSDPENTRLQYLFQKVEEMVKRENNRVLHTTCENRNRINAITRWMSGHEPSLAARILTGRQDVTGEHREHGIILSQCVHMRETADSNLTHGRDPIFNKPSTDNIHDRTSAILLRLKTGSETYGTMEDSTRRTGVLESIEEEADAFAEGVERTAQSIEREIEEIARNWKVILVLVVVVVLASAVTAIFCLIKAYFPNLICHRHRRRDTRLTLEVKSGRELEDLQYTPAKIVLPTKR